MVPKFRNDVPSLIFVNANAEFYYQLGELNMDFEDVEITVTYNDAKSFLKFDENTLSFSIEPDLAIAGIYKVFIDLVYESELGA